MNGFGITPKQREFLDAFTAFENTNGYAPSYDEMKTRSALSPSAISNLVDELEQRGYLCRLPNRSRSGGAAMRLIAWFNSAHLFSKRRIVSAAICARMNAAVTIGAERNYVSRIVRAAVRQTSNMMRLEIWHPASSQKRGRGSAPFTVPLGSCYDVIANMAATLKNARGGLGFAGAFFCGRHRQGSKSRKIGFCRGSLGRNVFHDLCDVLDRPQFENNRLAQIALAIRRLLNMVRFVDELAFKTQTGLFLFEEEEAFPVGRMVRDRFIAGSQRHVADLAFAEVFEHSVSPCPVGIPVFKPFLAGNDNHKVVLCRRDDPALLLAPKARVNIPSAIVNLPALKAPAHALPLTFSTLARQSHGATEFSTGEAA